MRTIENGREAERTGGTLSFREHPRVVQLQRRRVHTARSKTDPQFIGTMAGHFAVFRQWAEIQDFDGTYLESIAEGAFAKTIAENRHGIRCLFQHGRDASCGSKPLGVVRS